MPYLEDDFDSFIEQDELQELMLRSEGINIDQIQKLKEEERARGIDRLEKGNPK